REVLAAVDADPQLPAHVLAGGSSDADGSVPGWIEALWNRWARDDIDAMAALSSPARDIPHLLCQAALRPLPRPTARSGTLDRIRARIRRFVPDHPASAVEAALEAFIDAEVEDYTDFDRIRRPLTPEQRSRKVASAAAPPEECVEAALEAFIDAEVEDYTDFDRIRRPLTPEQRSRKVASAAALPGLCVQAARQLGVTRLDVLSGLIGALTDPLPIVDARYFTPTPWRLPT